MIAAVYAALTISLAPISYGPLQLRVSEALTLLPFYMPEAVPGLFIGCVFANAYGGFGLADMFFGGLATLIAAVLSRRSKNLWLAALWPVISNMIIIGTMLYFLLDFHLIEVSLFVTWLDVGIGEAAACFVVGVPLMKILEKRNLICRE